MLTTKQKELLMFIHERLKETGVPPSFDEMKEALDLKSKSGIHRLITALEDGVCPPPAAPRPRHGDREAARSCLRRSRNAPGFSPSVIEGSLAAAPVAEGEACPDGQRPVMGRIAAGVPIEAIRHASIPSRCHRSCCPGRALRARGEGDSMIDAGFSTATPSSSKNRGREQWRHCRGAGG